MTRVCYHIQSHRDPAQVLRLVRRIRSMSRNSIILVSHQVGGEPLDHAAFESVGSAHVLPTTGGYGDFSHVDRYLESVRWLIEHDESFDWFLNISGQDYPTIELASAERELATSDVSAFIQMFPVFDATSHWSHRTASTRYAYRHVRIAPPKPWIQKYSRSLAALNTVQPWIRYSPTFVSIGRRTPMPFSTDFTCYGGSFYANLSAEAVRHVLDFCDRHPDFVAWARGVLAPDEIFIPTVLGNTPGLRIRNDCKRYFDFSESRANHPKTLTEEDLPRVLASGSWFARKFAADASALDRLDAILDERVGR